MVAILFLFYIDVNYPSLPRVQITKEFSRENEAKRASI